MNYLLFQLYGAIQSWGSTCPGSTRRTDDHPTKSGTLGMVAACLGIDYGDVEGLTDLSSSTSFSCRTDIPGSLMEDYHTISNETRETFVTFPTIESYRYYLAGALFTICLWKNRESAFDLKRMADSLDSPVFTPFLGRSCCMPGLPFSPALVKTDTLKEAFKSYVADQYGLLVEHKIIHPKVYWEGSDNSITSLRKIYRYDSPKNVLTHSFGQRLEYEGRL